MKIYTYRSAHSRSAKNFKRFFSAALSLLVVLQMAPGAFAVKYAQADVTSPYGTNPIDKVTLCHSTGSAKNPFTNPEVNISSSGAPQGGHDNDPNDIIPPYYWSDGSTVSLYQGKNWTPDNEIVWNHGGCNGVVVPPVPGCTNPAATNYNPNATVDDGSCVLPPPPVPGCMNPLATNYNPNATVDDGSCVLPPPPVLGCTNPQANNYNPSATQDDGSCTFNVPTGTITVHKILINDDGGTAATSSFSFRINGTSTTAFESDGANDLTLPVGTYSITEVSAAGYSPSYSASCTNFQITAGQQSAMCVITNDDIARQADPSADLSITKSVDDSTPDEGQTLVYTIVATNNGGDNATGVVVNDVLPAGLTYVSASSSVGSFNGGTGAWTIGNLSSGASATLQLTVTVGAETAGNTIINTATVDGNEGDPNGNNNNASSSVTVNTPNQGPNRFTLIVTITGDGTGHVTGNGIDCVSGESAGDCSETYDEGTVVDLTATPNEGSNFDSTWTVSGGTCTGNTTPCQVTMNSNMALTAHFGLNPVTTTTTTSHRSGGGHTVVTGGSTPQGQVLGATFEPGLPNTGTGPIDPQSTTTQTLFVVLAGLMALAGLNVASFKLLKEEGGRV